MILHNRVTTSKTTPTTAILLSPLLHYYITTKITTTSNCYRYHHYCYCYYDLAIPDFFSGYCSPHSKHFDLLRQETDRKKSSNSSSTKITINQLLMIIQSQLNHSISQWMNALINKSINRPSSAIKPWLYRCQSLLWEHQPQNRQSTITSQHRLNQPALKSHARDRLTFNLAKLKLTRGQAVTFDLARLMYYEACSFGSGGLCSDANQLETTTQMIDDRPLGNPTTNPNCLSSDNAFVFLALAYEAGPTRLLLRRLMFPPEEEQPLRLTSSVSDLIFLSSAYFQSFTRQQPHPPTDGVRSVYYTRYKAIALTDRPPCPMTPQVWERGAAHLDCGASVRPCRYLSHPDQRRQLDLNKTHLETIYLFVHLCE